MTTVSFPGLGIGEIIMNEVAFSFDFFGLLKNPLEIRWYGIFITVGIILAILYAMKRTKEEGIILDDLLDMGIFTIIFGIIGARLYYVLTYGVSNFVVREGVGDDAKIKLWDTFVNLIAVWNGGIAIYGALIAGGLTIYLVCRHKKINFLKAFDAISPAVMIGQILGRWGNFVNGEAYGYEVKEGGFLYFLRMGILPNIESSSVMHYFHPTFLYESVWNLVGFILINILYKKKKFDGQVFFMYITWYGFGRMFIEGLRTDSLYVGVFRISQVVGFCCFAVGLTLIILGLIRAKKASYELQDYEPVYPKFAKKTTVKKETVMSDAQTEKSNKIDNVNEIEGVVKTNDAASNDDIKADKAPETKEITEETELEDKSSDN